MGKVVAVLHGGGLVQEEGGEQSGRLAVSGGLVPTEPTNGGIARGGSAERIREGVTGDLPLERVTGIAAGATGRCGVSPLEWVAPHEVEAKGKTFPYECDIG